MPIIHSCFVSYPHPRMAGSILDTFVQDLVAEVNERLDGFVPGRAYVDAERLKPTYDFDKALHDAMCKSLCMIVVYCPEYAQREYCRREFDLIARINEQRRKKLGSVVEERQFVALVSLAQNIPHQLQQTSWQVADFSSYKTLPNIGKRRIRHSRTLRHEVGLLVEAMQDLHTLVQGRSTFGSKALCCRQQLAKRDAIRPWTAIPFPR